MNPVPVTIAAVALSEDKDIAFIDDVDAIAGAEVMLGCGDDNPYH
jgi:hypothetical protein